MLILDTALLSDRCTGLIRQLRLTAPATRVVTIACEDDELALAALQAGAIGSH